METDKWMDRETEIKDRQKDRFMQRLEMLLQCTQRTWVVEKGTSVSEEVGQDAFAQRQAGKERQI